MSEEIKNINGGESAEVPLKTANDQEESTVITESATEEPAHSGEPQRMTEPQPAAEEPTLSPEPQITDNPSYHETSFHSGPPQNDGSSGKTVAALILGISSVALSFTMMLSFFGLAAGIVGLILAIKERKIHPSGMATASFILSLIGLIVGALSTVACVACMGFCGWLGYWGAFDDPGTMHMFDVMDL